MKVKAMSLVAQHDREVTQILELEAKRQASTVDLVASENHADCAILEAQGCLMTTNMLRGILGVVIMLVVPI
jgi:glycine/serine hydroxymethyltransferase